MKNLYLVDASNMFFRAFFAIPPLTSPKGMPTNALYGFLSMSLKLIRDVKPDYLVYCFDRKEPSFREEIYQDYKAHREEMPDDLQPQVPYLKKLTEALGIAQMEKSGFEADDVIGTLATFGTKHHMNVVIVSGDKDFAQLVRPGVTLYDTMKDVRTDVDGVKAKFGIRPDQIIDYLAMVGDSSDNIPGIRGIGPKGAQKLLSEYDTLEGVYKHIDDIKGATQKKLIEGKEDAFMSRRLSTIVTDVDLDLSPENFKMKPFEKEPLQALLQELGFGSFERKLFGGGDSEAPSKSGGGAKSTAPAKPATAAAKPSTKRAAKKISEWKEEQWTLSELKARVAPYAELWAILNERGLFFGYEGTVIRVAAEDREIGAVLGPKHLRWKGYDVKKVLKALGLSHVDVTWDGMLAAYVVRPNQVPPFEQIYEKYCEKRLPDLCTAADQMAAHLEFEGVLRDHLNEQDGLKVLEELDLPLVPVLTEMELKGLRIDTDELQRQSRALVADIQRLEAMIFKEAGETFNVGSPKQLGHILFEKMKLPAGRKTKTGYSTDSDVLESLAVEHPIAKHLIEYRELTKLKSTYLDALPALVDPKTGRVHTSLNQAATATGRLSSTNPNLQNIPIRTERGRQVRKAFIAAPGRRKSQTLGDHEQRE